jgi:hypothetical protein
MNGTKSEQNKNFLLPPSTSQNGMKTTLYSYPLSIQKYTNDYSKTTCLENITHNPKIPDGTRSWKTTLTSANGSTAGEMENPDYAPILRLLKKWSWPENVAALNERNDTDSAPCTTRWNLTTPKNGNVNWNNSNSNSYMKSWMKPDVA